MSQFSIGLGDLTTQGIVYVLTNQAMPDIVKIGCTSKEDIKYRLKELDNTSVPLPFECYCAYVIQNGNMKKVETALHHAFGDYRMRKSTVTLAGEDEKREEGLLLSLDAKKALHDEW